MKQRLVSLIGRAWAAGRGLRRPSVSDARFVLLSGISGSGKSTVCASASPPAVIVELDQFLLEGYSRLAVGPAGGDPFWYESWRIFLAEPASFLNCVRCFREYVKVRFNKRPGNPVIVVGNHFVVDGMVRMVTESVRSLGAPVLDKIAIDVPAMIVLKQRQARGNSYDLAVTLDEVNVEVMRLKERLGRQGFGFATCEEAGQRLLVAGQ
jgi:hypothetical protein